MTPEEVFEKSEGTDWDGKWLRFNAISNDERIDIIKTFIVKNQDNSVFKDELKTAKRFLETLNVGTDV